MWLDLARLALKNLGRRKARSVLTLLGIAVGMTAVVALWALSMGAQRSLEAQFAKFGTDTILVIPISGTQQPKPARLNLDLLQTVPGVKSVSALRRETLPVRGPTTAGFLTVVGVAMDRENLSLIGGLELAQGTLFNAQNDEALLGAEAIVDLQLQISNTLRIRERPFRVVGILKPTGSEQDDHAIYLELAKLEELVEEKGLISLVSVQSSSDADVTLLAQEIQKTLRSALAGQEFLVQSSRQLRELVNNALALVRWVLGSIAAISLIVGGIGLANTMLMVVLERTHEIGILKAIGAKRCHILGLFLIESGLLGFLGGAAGLIFGGAMAQSVALLAEQTLGTTTLGAALDLALMVGALLFSTALGVIAGVWPAWRASRLDPVEALRYE